METWLTVNQVLTEVLIDYGLRALIDTWKRILLAHIDAINLALWEWGGTRECSLHSSSS